MTPIDPVRVPGWATMRSQPMATSSAPEAARLPMAQTTTLSSASRRRPSRISWLVATAPPGESMRTTTAFMSASSP